MPNYYQEDPSDFAKTYVACWLWATGISVGNWNNDMNRTVYFRGHLIEFTPGGLDRLRKKLGGSYK